MFVTICITCDGGATAGRALTRRVGAAGHFAASQSDSNGATDQVLVH